MLASFIVSPAVSLSRIRHELPSVWCELRMCQDELLPSHSGGPDDRPPLLNIALLESTERLRRVLLARRKLLPLLGEPGTDRRIGQGVHDRGVELVDDDFRRAFRRKKRIPVRHVEAGQSRLVYRRDIWRDCQAPAGADGISLYRSGIHLWHGGGRRLDHDVENACHQILHRRTGTPVVQKLEMRACSVLE